MVTVDDVVQLVTQVLQVGSRAANFGAETPLLGGLPEFDSMAVVSILTAFEDEYGVVIEDDEVTAEIFATIGTLHAFLVGKA